MLVIDARNKFILQRVKILPNSKICFDCEILEIKLLSNIKAILLAN